MNIKRVPCLAVITAGPHRDRIVEVIERDYVAEQFFCRTIWFCRTPTPLLMNRLFSTPKMGTEGICPDASLRPIDDPGEPERVETADKVTA